MTNRSLSNAFFWDAVAGGVAHGVVWCYTAMLVVLSPIQTADINIVFPAIALC
jgi:hypothetical protein